MKQLQSWKSDDFTEGNRVMSNIIIAISIMNISIVHQNLIRVFLGAQIIFSSAVFVVC